MVEEHDAKEADERPGSEEPGPSSVEMLGRK
jgi:hypothetical protein